MNKEDVRKYEELAEAAFSYARETYLLMSREKGFKESLARLSEPGKTDEEMIVSAGWATACVGELAEMKHIINLASEYMIGKPLVKTTLRQIDALSEKMCTTLTECFYEKGIALKDVLSFCRKSFGFTEPEWKDTEQMLMDKAFKLIEENA